MIKKLVKKPAKKDDVTELKREMTRLRRESHAKIKGFESQVESQVKDIQRKLKEIERLKTELQQKDQDFEKKRKDFSQLKDESSSKVKELESKIQEITEELGKKEDDLLASKKLLDEKDRELGKTKNDLFQLKKENSSTIESLESKVKEITVEVGKKEEDLQALKNLLNQREEELRRLGEQIECENQRLASKDVETESYKKVTEERILLLEARVKELEGKAVEPSSRGEAVFALYRKNRQKDQTRYQFLQKVPLFGCDEGFIPRLLGKQMPDGQKEPYLWHLQIENALAKAEYPNSTLVIDPKPKQKKTNFSLYEVLEVWGYSAAGWTPILLHLSRLFVDEDPQKFDRNDFWIRADKRDEPIYAVLYLDGTISNGKFIGGWNAPPASPTNAALLWPDTLRYFFRCIREQIPHMFY